MIRGITVVAGLALAAQIAPAQLAEGEDRVLWRVPTPGPECWRQFVTVGPDGTVYTADREGTYALRPDGTVKWFTTESRGADGGAGRPISIGPDGTVYSGMGLDNGRYAAVIALDPEDGSVRWRYFTPNGGPIDGGPNVGPDGNIYGLQQVEPTDGLGAFALSPDGELLWSNPGDPVFSSLQVIGNSDIVFGADRVYAAAWFPRSGQAVMYAFDTGGDQVWSSWELDHTGVKFPLVDNADRVITGWGQTGVRAISRDGEESWHAIHPNQLSVNRPAIDSAGNVYVGNAFGLRLWSVDRDGVTRWLLPLDSGQGMDEAGVTPDDALLVAGGGGGFGEPGWVRAYDTADGSLQWQVDLPEEQGFAQYTTCMEPAFSADSRTAYFTTHFSAGGIGHGYIIAIRTGEACPADFNGDGVVNTLDVLSFLNAWAAGDAAADFNGDGTVNTLDVLAFLNAWSGGC